MVSIKVEIDWDNDNSFDHAQSDVTDYVLSVNCRSSTRGTLSTGFLPDEGSASVVLSNTDKRFSPANSSSPLYGDFLSNLRIKISVVDDSAVTHQLWIGWINNYNVSTSEYGTLTTEITCNQQLFNTYYKSFTWTIPEEATATEILQQLQEENPLTLAANGNPPIVGGAVVGTAQLADLSFDTVYANYDTTTDVYEYAGVDWDNYKRVFEDLIKAEQGLLWVDRDGYFNFRDRYYVMSGAGGSATDIDLDTDAMSSQYSYGNDIVNKFTAYYHPKKLVSGTIFETSEDLTIPANDFIEFKPKFETDDGTKVAVYAITAVNITSTNNVQQGSLVLENNQASMRLTNLDGTEATDVSVSIVGNRVDYYAPQAIEILNAASILANNDVYEREFDSPLVSSQTQANNIAQTAAYFKKDPLGEFTGFTIKDRDADFVTNMMGLTIGDFVSLSESQTQEEDVVHLITGETFDWTPENLTVNFDTVRADVFPFAVVGTAQVDISVLI